MGKAKPEAGKPIARRRPRKVLVGGSLLLLLAGAGLFQLSRERCLSLVLPSICRVDTSEKVVALSFDDGPTAQGLDAVLPVLQAANARATFFVVGETVEQRPDQLRRLQAAGMEVGNHSWSHRRLVGRLPGTYAHEIDATASLLARHGVTDNKLFRAPYGKKLFGLPAALRRRGYRLVMADVVDPPGARTAEDYAERMLAEVRPGSILLIHPMFRGNEVERAAVPLVVHGLRQRGYRIVSVGELLALKSDAS